ncbi:MAG TPA: aspartate--tRNA ligase [Anaerovoracaceae bacterium]|nr:aspartate--tRNA ligase [Anaerovoracaceae bacterium]
MKYETVIGLEVHVELSTKTKIFCDCTTAFGGLPNSHTCPVCLGLPGSLPVFNKAVADKAIKAGLALHCEITRNNRFDRKNYFYPDLPKDYQISQLYAPICRNGCLEIELQDKSRKRITIREIHMEEDAGKLIHDNSGTLIDYNRCGVPLIEIVTNPDFSSPEEVGAFLERLQETLVYLDVSDCKMQEGSMRADVNVSVRPEGQAEYGTRTEMKNLNSLKAIQRAIAFENERQIKVLEEGGKVKQETRRWDDDQGISYAMRSKENAQDYRYFPDPDLLPILIGDDWLEEMKNSMAELPEAKRARYKDKFGLSEKAAKTLTSAKEIAKLFEETAAISGQAAETANTVIGDILRLMKDTATLPEQLKLDATRLARIIQMVIQGKINRSVGKSLIEELFKNGIDPEAYVKEHGLLMVDNSSLIEPVVLEVLNAHPQSIEDYRNGKEKAFDFLVGQCMRLLKGSASPQAIHGLLKEKLETLDPALTSKLAETAARSGLLKQTAAVAAETAAEKSESKPAGEADLTEHEKYEQEKAAQSSAFASYGKYAGKKPSVQGSAQESGQEPISVHRSQAYRTKNCGEITIADVGKEIKLAGWIHTIRDHGGVAFLDLRDHYGVTQAVVSDQLLEGLNKETVVSVSGTVIKRDEETYNPNLATGEVELKAESVRILGSSLNNLPFEIDSSTDTGEDVRLKYRFLDLRNPKVHSNMVLRSEIIKCLRNQMERMDFLEIQTPILANSSPEGARDYLVPSRKHKGKFYALPQAPQQFKQLLMVSGFDKYFQIAPCFRDEDARIDRSPGEFYQLDFEMAFATQEDVFAVAEQVLSETFRRFSDKKISAAPFVRIPFAEAMLKYGTDKPDLRNPLEIIDLSDFFRQVDFKPFQGKIVRGITVGGCAKMPKSFFESMEKFALGIGMKGLGYISVKDDMTYKGPIDKFFTDDQRVEIAKIASLKAEDVLYFISDEKGLVEKYAGQIRTEFGKRLDLIKKDRFEFCFITDFPMYEINEETGNVEFTHNPFSMPQGEMEALLTMNPLEIKAYQYDIVCNGVELSSGAVRNHRPEVMVKAFEIAGYTEEDVKTKFGALYQAFRYGAPPHAGMAPGVDRIVMLLSEVENIREVIPFPLNSNAQNTMLNCPSEVDEKQLREVHIKIR